MKTILFLALVIWFAVGCGDTSKTAHSPVRTTRVLVVASLHGYSGSFGKQGLEGFEAALKVPDRVHVETVFLDDNASHLDPHTIVQTAREQNVSAIVSIQNSSAVLALAPVASSVGFPVLAVTATHEDIPRYPYTTQLSMSNETEGSAAAFYLHEERHIERVAVVYDGDDVFSKSVARHFADVFEKLDGNVTVFGDVAKSHDYVLAEKMRRTHSDALYMALYSDDAVHFLDAARRAHWRPKLLMGVDGFVDEMRLRHGTRLASLEGLLVVEHFSEPMPASRVVHTARKILDKRLSTVRGLGYEAGLLLRRALGACAADDRECINAHLRNSGTFDGVGGRLRIESGHARRPVYIDRLTHGKMQMVVKIY